MSLKSKVERLITLIRGTGMCMRPTQTRRYFDILAKRKVCGMTRLGGFGSPPLHLAAPLL